MYVYTIFLYFLSLALYSFFICIFSYISILLLLPCTVCIINNTPQTPGVYPALFVDDTCMYTTDRKEGYVLRKLRYAVSLQWNGGVGIGT
jgi:hypothetical protein